MQSPSTSDWQPRKRFRITLVCNVCKIRKVKCDRKSPCTSCIKHNTGHMCNYDEQIWISQLPQRDNGVILGLNNNIIYSNSNNNSSNNSNNNGSPNVTASPPIQSEVKELRDKLSRLERLIITTNQANLNEIVDVEIALENFKDLRSVIGINPIGTSEDTLNLYSNFGTIRTDKSEYSKRIDFAPFTFHGLLRRDPSLLDVWYYITQKRANLKKKQIDNGAASTPFEMPKLNAKSVANSKSSNHKSVLMKIRRYSERKFNQKKFSSSITSPGILLQSSSPGAEGSALSANEESLFLPPNETIWMYIENFFLKIYKYFPFVDEDDFRENIKRILEGRSSSQIRKLQDKKDFAILGQLYIILRIGYLSMVSRAEYGEFQRSQNSINSVTSGSPSSSSSSSPIPNRSYSLYPIGVEYVDYAKRCLNCFDLLQPVDINIVQFCLLLCSYLKLAPEDGEGPDRNQFQIFLGTLVQMAFSIGLNRDPNKFQEFAVSESQNHLRRKIWNEIVLLDLYSSTLFGNAPNIQRRYYDTIYPYYSIGCEGISSNPPLEREIIEIHKPREILIQKTKQMVESILEVNEEVKLRTLSNYLSEMEIILHKEFGFLPNYNENDLSHKLNMNLFIQLRIFHTSLYYELFLYYEREKNVELMFFYFKKTICVIIEEYAPLVFNLAMNGGKDSKGTGGDKITPENLMLYPGLEQLVHRMNGILFSIIVRIKYTLRMLLTDNTSKSEAEMRAYCKELEKLGYLLKVTVKGAIVGISQISDMYWFAWRIAKAHSYIFNVITADEYYSSIDEYEREKSLPTIIFSLAQIKEARTMIDQCLSKYRRRGIGSQWSVVSDVSEATTSEDAQENDEISTSTISDLNFNTDIDDVWNNSNFNNIQNHFGLSNEDFTYVLESKEFKDVMENYFDLDEPLFNTFGQFTTDT
ncbi:multidrug resistance regulator 1 [[Candida] railenensis]|uniref:Multidrug resistance regulator 1 n=1 Tax=[Candida] railenensis TaxID=45579 RepID=A0A9P0VZL0_9ASCO|nr:multidrug resistance regulator 1 [[Candida] railenensis]